MNFVVTIDGPAGAGKSTTARAVARALGFIYVDTGALYRALALRVLNHGVPPEDDGALESGLLDARLVLSGSPDHPVVWLDGADVSEEIRSPAVSEMSSRLAARPLVRRQLVDVQRALRVRGPLVAEGRDLGTVVFPDAQVKIYLDADPETRARRRHDELLRRGLPVKLEDVADDLRRRDLRDRSRTDSPLKPAADAQVLDTSGMTSEDQVAEVLRRVRGHPECPAAAREPDSTGPPEPKSAPE